MDPNLNRNSMGSRAGGNFRNNLAGGAIGAPSRLGTAGRVIHGFNLGANSSWRSGIDCQCPRKTHLERGWHHRPQRSQHAEASL